MVTRSGSSSLALRVAVPSLAVAGVIAGFSYLRHRLQRARLFLPDRYPSGVWRPHRFGLPAEDIWFQSEDGSTLHGWWMLHPRARGTLLYCHGSAGSIAHLLPSLFGRISDSLPTFAHAFAFSLLTAAWFGGGRRIGLAACLTWFGVDTAFEVGQHPQIAERLVRFIPDGFGGLPILDQADSYFLSGTFDAWDLTSIAVGAAAAYLLIRCTEPKDEPHG